jgi:hypothetical protein
MTSELSGIAFPAPAEQESARWPAQPATCFLKIGLPKLTTS